MKRILYSSGSVLTGDDIARSVVKYATVLAKVGSADTIRIPVVKNHSSTIVEMLISPSSQLIVEDVEDEPGTGPDDPAVVAEIEERRDRLEHPPPIESRNRPAEGFSAYYDL